MLKLVIVILIITVIIDIFLNDSIYKKIIMVWLLFVNANLQFKKCKKNLILCVGLGPFYTLYMLFSH